MIHVPKRLSTILGNSQKLDGGAMFGNAPKALWSRWVNVDEANRIDLACRALLVREPSRNLLIETGIGAFFEPDLQRRYGVVESEHRLLESLAEHGLSDADIDVVILSHLHFDHAGGLLAAYQAGKAAQLLFPNARFVVGAEAWERAKNPHPRDRASFIPELVGLLEKSGRLQLVGEGVEGTARCDLLGADYRFHFSHGHTPGMMLPEITGQQGAVIFAADLIPAAPWLHVPITMGYDRFPELLIDEKRRLLEHCLENQSWLLLTHDPEVAAAQVQRDAKGRFITLNTVNKWFNMPL